LAARARRARGNERRSVGGMEQQPRIRHGGRGLPEARRLRAEDRRPLQPPPYPHVPPPLPALARCLLGSGACRSTPPARAEDTMKIYLDGELVARDDARVSVFDHGLLYGDGVFEGIRVYGRRIFRLDAHLDRLYASAQAIALTIPLDPSAMADAV